MVPGVMGLQGPQACKAAPRDAYLGAITALDAAHHHFLSCLDDELRRRDILTVNPIQALLLFRIGDRILTSGEIRRGGFYNGTNVSYNLNKLEEAGLMLRERGKLGDGRKTRVELTKTGKHIVAIVTKLLDRHVEQLRQVSIFSGETTLDKTLEGLNRLDRFWTDQVAYQL